MELVDQNKELQQSLSKYLELDAEFTCPVGEGSDSDSDSDTDRTSDSEFCKSDDDMGVNT